MHDYRSRRSPELQPKAVEDPIDYKMEFVDGEFTLIKIYRSRMISAENLISISLWPKARGNFVQVEATLR